jgi:hypothetical protein
LSLGLSLGVEGYAGTIAYFTAILPAHIHSELGANFQYSLSTVAVAFGAADNVAQKAGLVWSLVTLIVGVWCAGILSRRYRDASMLVLLPPALAVFGGSYIHLVQMPFAIPFALVLASDERTLRPYLIAAVALVAIPWTLIAPLDISPSTAPAGARPTDLAEVAWEQFAREMAWGGSSASWFARVPVWTALLVIFASTVIATVRRTTAVAPAVRTVA